jgi:peptidoglycan/xylan/chitin deacetylase (PgdA/CDA1 family)
VTGSALILTYHAVEPGPPPLCTDPALFREQLDVLTDADATVLTVGGIADSLRQGTLPPRAVAISFDDGFASVAEHAAPALAERGLPATVFCVAGALGRTNDWPSQPARAPRRPLAGAPELRELRDAGMEIGSHGVEHAPLTGAPERLARREVVDSRAMLEDVVAGPVRSFAYPYGAAPSAAAERLVRETYAAACGTDLGSVPGGADPFRLPRVDAYYVRRPELLGRAVQGSLGAYLTLRRVGARSRRLVVKDYRRGAAA